MVPLGVSPTRQHQLLPTPVSLKTHEIRGAHSGVGRKFSERLGVHSIPIDAGERLRFSDKSEIFDEATESIRLLWYGSSWLGIVVFPARRYLGIDGS